MCFNEGKPMNHLAKGPLRRWSRWRLSRCNRKGLGYWGEISKRQDVSLPYPGAVFRQTCARGRWTFGARTGRRVQVAASASEIRIVEVRVRWMRLWMAMHRGEGASGAVSAVVPIRSRTSCGRG